MDRSCARTPERYDLAHGRFVCRPRPSRGGVGAYSLRSVCFAAPVSARAAAPAHTQSASYRALMDPFLQRSRSLPCRIETVILGVRQSLIWGADSHMRLTAHLPMLVDKAAAAGVSGLLHLSLVSVADHVSRQCNVDERCELPAVDAYAAGYDAFKRASEEALASSCERLQLACIHLRLSGLLSNHRDCIQCSAIRKQMHAPPPPFSSARLIVVFACRLSAPGKPPWWVARPPAPAWQSASSQSLPFHRHTCFHGPHALSPPAALRPSLPHLIPSFAHNCAPPPVSRHVSPSPCPTRSTSTRPTTSAWPCTTYFLPSPLPPPRGAGRPPIFTRDRRLRPRSRIPSLSWARTAGPTGAGWYWTFRRGSACLSSKPSACSSARCTGSPGRFYSWAWSTCSRWPRVNTPLTTASSSKLSGASGRPRRACATRLGEYAGDTEESAMRR